MRCACGCGACRRRSRSCCRSWRRSGARRRRSCSAPRRASTTTRCRRPCARPSTTTCSPTAQTTRSRSGTTSCARRSTPTCWAASGRRSTPRWSVRWAPARAGGARLPLARGGSRRRGAGGVGGRGAGGRGRPRVRRGASPPPLRARALGCRRRAAARPHRAARARVGDRAPHGRARSGGRLVRGGAGGAGGKRRRRAHGALPRAPRAPAFLRGRQRARRVPRGAAGAPAGGPLRARAAARRRGVRAVGDRAAGGGGSAQRGGARARRGGGRAPSPMPR